MTTMKQEDEELLLKDLSARLPYGVMIQHPESFYPQRKVVEKLVTINDLWRFNDDGWFIEYVRPYLRPMSSMTEEESTEYLNACGNEMDNPLSSPRYSGIDWLLKNHFDFRGLIEKGLAIEAPEGMYS